jgi:hypothetical protein
MLASINSLAQNKNKILLDIKHHEMQNKKLADEEPKRISTNGLQAAINIDNHR